MFHYKDLDRHGLFGTSAETYRNILQELQQELSWRNLRRERRQDCYVVNIKKIIERGIALTKRG